MKQKHGTILLLVAMLWAASGLAAADKKPSFREHQLLIKINTVMGTTASLQNTLLHKYIGEVRSIHYVERAGCHLLETYSETDLQKLKGRLEKEAWCQTVAFNHIARIAETTPDDEYFKYQYHLKNTGQYVLPPSAPKNYNGKSGADIKATDGWDWTQGSENVVIAVIDTGIEKNHEDLSNKLVTGANIIDANSLPQDDNGHGTFVASIAAAETDNKVGVAGVCWNAQLMPIKAFDENGEADTLAVVTAIGEAVRLGAKIINMSFCFDSPNPFIENACKDAFEKGCVLIAAAGDHDEEEEEENIKVAYPAAYDDYCLAVGASDANDQLWNQSNYGPQIDLVAPGVYIWGAYFNPAEPSDLRDYQTKSGTSFSTAIVSGAAALLLSFKPDLTNEQVMKLLCYTADDINENIQPKWDKYMGYGRINLKTLLSPFELKKPDAQLPES